MGKNRKIKPKQWQADDKKTERMLGVTNNLEMTTKLLSVFDSLICHLRGSPC